MEISVGTYDGTLSFLHCNLTQIIPIKSLQISTTSIKSLCLLNNQFLLAGGHDQQLRVLDLQTHQQKIQAKQNTGQITKIAPVDTKLFVVGVEDGTIRLWDSGNWSIVREARVHKKGVSGIAVGGEGKVMVTAGGSKIVVWAARGLKKMHEYKYEKDVDIENLKMSQDLKEIYYSNSKAELYRITTDNNEQKLVVKMPVARKIQDFLLCGAFIIVANDLGEISAWRLTQSLNQEGPIDFDKRIWFKAHDARIKELKIVQKSYLLVVTAAGDISLWDFPQFLESVEHISQNYQLQGLKPLCATQIKGRILCVDAVVLGKLEDKNKKEQEPLKEEQEQENGEENEAKRSKKQKKKIKTKQIQKTEPQKPSKKLKIKNKIKTQNKNN